MLIVGDSEKGCFQRYFGRQIEGMPRGLVDGFLQLPDRPISGIDDFPTWLGATGRHHHLVRDSARSLE
ncbi:Uncharacterised protein [Mycobacteroides abscessus subsp. abscessus]|nr:Uncharacterised protein [Mycobacteroides abscessus subsp. abscessus]